MKRSILLFGGTTEGTQLARGLSRAGWEVTVCVATEYGAQLLTEVDVQVHTGRLDAAGMARLMASGSFSTVIDATHPYATLASEQIQAAAARAGLPYERAVRPAESVQEDELCVPDPEAAVELLTSRTGNILLTTGSKNLDVFSQLTDFSRRVWVRILPSEDALRRALSLGCPPSHIIAMQGPFSQALNEALLRQFDIALLVTKRSGAAGGFPEKAAAARAVGAALVVIDRPTPERGTSVAELLRKYGGKLE